MKARKNSNAGHELRILGIILIDILIINLAAFLAIMLRMDFSLEDVAAHGFLRTLRMGAIPGTISALLMFKIFGLYSSAWEYAGERELISIGFASVCASALYYMAVKLMSCLFPRSFPFIYAVVLFITISASRVAYRQVRRNLIARNAAKDGKLRRTMLIGAGDGAVLVIRELENNPHARNRVLCLIDDDPAKRGTRVRGIKVVGGRDKIVEAAKRYDIEDIIFCIPSASDKLRNEILEICSRTGAQLKTLPSLDKLISGELTLTQIKNVSIEDLLGRTQVHTDNAAIRDKIQGKTVLVTGGGGSMGSELCRQVAALSPRRLIIFDTQDDP
ncbi:MAG: polysaccharide biosynthesis protein [Oscillospiraceae bacterium]